MKDFNERKSQNVNCEPVNFCDESLTLDRRFSESYTAVCFRITERPLFFCTSKIRFAGTFYVPLRGHNRLFGKKFISPNRILTKCISYNLIDCISLKHYSNKKAEMPGTKFFSNINYLIACTSDLCALNAQAG